MLGFEPRAVVAPDRAGLWLGTWCAIDIEGEKREVADPKGAAEPKPLVEPALATVLAARGVVLTREEVTPLLADGGGSLLAAATEAPSQSCCVQGPCCMAAVLRAVVAARFARAAMGSWSSLAASVFSWPDRRPLSPPLSAFCGGQAAYHTNVVIATYSHEHLFKQNGMRVDPAMCARGAMCDPPCRQE